MVQIGPKWDNIVQTVQNGPEWSTTVQVIKNCPKLSKRVQIGPKRSEINQNDPKWSRTVQKVLSIKKGPKLPKVTKIIWYGPKYQKGSKTL